MDPMDYAFNHAPPSEAPYHITVSSVAPPWMAYGSGPDVGSGLDSFYVSPAPALPLPFPDGTTAHATTYQYHLSQGSALPWSSGFLHSSAPEDHVLSRSSNIISPSAGERESQIPGPQRSRPWSLTQTRDHASRLDSRNGRGLFLPSSSAQIAQSGTCSNDGEMIMSPPDSFSGLVIASGLTTSPISSERMSSRTQRWPYDDNRPLPDLLPPLRSQSPFPPSASEAASHLPSLHQNLGNSSRPPVMPSRSDFVTQMRHSPAIPGDSSLLRLDEAAAPSQTSTTGSSTRSGHQSPHPRTHRSIQTYATDAQRPFSATFDMGMTSRVPSTTPPTASTSSIPVLNPRRQRPSRPGPRRFTTNPRSPSHSNGRNGIDRPLIQEYLASQNIGPTDWIKGHSYTMIEEIMYRNLQVLQGSMGTTRIARKSMINSLPPISIQDLPEDERACTICYSVYGVESPEGIVEEALRLPDCKHVFGSRCLKTWLKDSEKCPYCRRKLPSEPKWFASAAKRILRLLMHSQSAGFHATDNETCLAVVRGYDRGGWLQSPLTSSTTSRTSLSTSRGAPSFDMHAAWGLHSEQEGMMLQNGVSARTTSPPTDDAVNRI